MGGYGTGTEEEELADVQRNRDLQRLLYDGGFAGIAFPKAYGGQGLTIDHHMAFGEELTGYAYPSRFQVPTMQPCAAIITEFGTEEQKQLHLPRIFKGEALWMQLLSEPSGGSDVAGAQTSAVRDGDEWIINGSKIWTTGAWWSDWGLALVRTNWDVPKHRGLSVFVFELHQPAIEIHQIEMLNGAKEFCQEFITDLRVPDSQRIGEVDDGWTVGIRWMYHERSFGGRSPYVTRPAGFMMRQGGSGGDPMLSLARRAGKIDDPRTRELVGEAHTLGVVAGSLNKRIGTLIATGQITDQAAAMGKVMSGTMVRNTSISYEIAGASAAAWDPDDDGRRPARWGRHRLPEPADGRDRRRHDRDGPQRDQRAGARHAAGAHPRQGRAVQGRPEGPTGFPLTCPTAASGGLHGRTRMRREDT